MSTARIMRTLARWHIWLGWLVGVPIVLWLASGLFMTLRPLPDVRGDHLRREVPAQPLVIADGALLAPASDLMDMRITMQQGHAVAVLTGMDGTVTRVDVATGQNIAPLDAASARALVEQRIVGGEKVAAVRAFSAEQAPFDFRRPLAVWQVALADGTNVYVGRDTGEIEAVRTRWWRWFDLAWGLHIMDFSEREDTSHPVLIVFAALSLSGALVGCVLLFRKRKTRPGAERSVQP
jgi:hypothetical protein